MSLLQDENGALWLFPGEDQLEIDKKELIDIIDRMEEASPYDIQWALNQKKMKNYLKVIIPNTGSPNLQTKGGGGRMWGMR